MNKNGCYIDLHAHLDGSVTVDIAKKLAALQNIALPADNDKELLTLLSVPDSCESLNDFLQCFDLPGRRVMRKVLGRCAGYSGRK